MAGERHDHFDAAGVLTGFTVVTREPEFLPDDLPWLLASRAVEADLGSHGIPMSEALDPANQFEFEGEGPFTDWAEKHRMDWQDAYYKARDQKNAPVNRNGHIFRVKRR